MKTIILAFIFLATTSFTLPLSDTWNGTTDSQLVSGNALRDAGAIGVLTITTPIPTELNKKAMTKANLETYTSISTGSYPLSEYSSNQCISKSAILGTF